MSRRANLTQQERVAIYRRFSRGESAIALAKEFDCERSTIYQTSRQGRKGQFSGMEYKRPARVVPKAYKSRQPAMRAFSTAECRKVVFMSSNMGLPTAEVAEDREMTEAEVRAVMAKYYNDHDCYGPIDETVMSEPDYKTHTTRVYEFECNTVGCKYHGHKFKTNLRPTEAFCPCCRVRHVGLEFIGHEDIIRRSRANAPGAY